MRRYRQQPKFRLETLFNRYTYKYWIIGAAAILLAVAGVLFWKSAKKLRPAETAMYAQEEITIGIANSCFSSPGEDGLPSGFDREAAEEIIHAVYPDGIAGVGSRRGLRSGLTLSKGAHRNHCSDHENGQERRK